MGQRRSAGGRELSSCHLVAESHQVEMSLKHKSLSVYRDLAAVVPIFIFLEKYKDDLWVRVGIVLVTRNLSELLGRGRSSLCSYCCVNSRNSFTPLSFG